MEFHLKPGGTVQGEARVPGDKSISHRSIMLGAIAQGITRVSGFLEGEDALATVAAFRAMGVRIEGPDNGNVVVHGVGLHGLKPPAQPIDLGNSGTSIRLLSGLLAGQAFASELTGDKSLCGRPMGRVITPLGLMGAQIDSEEGRPPLRIAGGTSLKAIHYDLPMASAQVKSCVLLAGLYADGETSVTEPAPTRDHTERMLNGFGYPVNRDEDGRISVHGGGRLRGMNIEVPADISSAAFFLVAASIAPGSDLTLSHVGMNPTRTGVINILRQMGADIEVSNPREVGGEPVADLRVRSAALKGIEIPVDQVPLAIDEFPAIFVAASCAQGRTTLRGAEELRVKESDRIAAMAEGLSTLGVAAEVLEDGIIIDGFGDTGHFGGGTVDSHHDHRIAMSFAVAALRASDDIRILQTDNVATSFPGFDALARGAGRAAHRSGLMTEPVAAGVPVITVDGPSGAGKGTIAHLLAERLGWHLLDSGALYRVTAHACVVEGVQWTDAPEVAAIARHLDVEFLRADTGEVLVLYRGEDCSRDIRTEEGGRGASTVAAIPEVRDALLARQRDFAEPPGLIADGRDMGTVVFPNAALKFFLTASAEERARRRYRQLKEKGESVSLARLLGDIQERDERDSSRLVSPLLPADDAIVIDSTATPIDEVFAMIMASVNREFQDINQ